jgi:hypothetical protein
MGVSIFVETRCKEMVNFRQHRGRNIFNSLPLVLSSVRWKDGHVIKRIKTSGQCHLSSS